MQALLAEPRAHLTEALILEAESLVRGATIRNGVDMLDSSGLWTGALTFETAGSSVTWGYRAPDRTSGQSDAVAAVRRRASFTVPGSTAESTLLSATLRPWTEWLLTDGRWARYHLGVFRPVNPGALRHDGTRTSRILECYDKSHRWANTTLTEPLTVAAGTAVVAYVKGSLSTRFGETSTAITDSSATLPTARTFETGTSWLDVYSRLLEAVAYDQLSADEGGRPSSRPLSVLAGLGPERTYGVSPGQGRIRTAGEVAPLLAALPNVVRFSARQGPSLGNVEGNGLRTKKNQSTGPSSIDARGGLEVELRVDVDVDTQAALDEVANADAQRYFAGGGLRYTGTIGLSPRHSDRDVIGLELPHVGLTGGAWLVTEWTYPLAELSSETAAVMPIIAERRVA